MWYEKAKFAYKPRPPLVAKSIAEIPRANEIVRPTGHLSPRFVRTTTPFI